MIMFSTLKIAITTTRVINVRVQANVAAFLETTNREHVAVTYIITLSLSYHILITINLTFKCEIAHGFTGKFISS